MPTLDRNSPLPLYYQLKQVLLEQIEAGQWKAGDLFPSENELQESYGLSRTTVRQTLNEMVVEGRLLRQRGRGTFVAKPKLAHDPAGHMGLTEFMRQQGLTPGWRVLERGWVEAHGPIVEALGLTEGEQVYRLHRLRLANDEVIGYHDAYVIAAAASHLDEAELETDGSLAYLHNAPQLHASRASRTIEAIAADEEEVRLLAVELGDPILLIERCTVAADGRPVEWLRAYYRGDRFKYRITV